VATRNSQKGTQEGLASFARLHRATAALSSRAIVFYLDSPVQPTPEDVAAAVLDPADSRRWTVEWLQQMLALIPGYAQALNAALQRPPARPRAPPPQPPSSPLPAPPPLYSARREPFGGLLYDSPGFFSGEIADITTDVIC
jgi:hypothetical protein